MTKPAYHPNLEDSKIAFSNFLETVAALRHPETGCPWDLEQTHQSLARFMIEEAYEASEQMINPKNPKKLCEELGDVLLQVVLNAQLALDQEQFSIGDVIRSINEKMKRRHPHVFGSEEDKTQKDLKTIKEKWVNIKAAEQRDGNLAANKTTPPEQTGIFSQAKIDKVHPAAIKAHKIGEIARRINFDWGNSFEVLEKLESEIAELREAMESNLKSDNSKNVEEELGDVFFSANQLARHLGLNGESIAERGNLKFLNRFSLMEKLAFQRGIDLNRSSNQALENLWLEAKAEQKGKL
jgi:MazG family protein